MSSRSTLGSEYLGDRPGDELLGMDAVAGQIIRYALRLEPVDQVEAALSPEGVALDVIQSLIAKNDSLAENDDAKREIDSAKIIGVFGHWGAGKTHLLNILGSMLASRGRTAQRKDGEPSAGMRDCIYVCCFRAWEYETEENIATAFVRALVTARNYPWNEGLPDFTAVAESNGKSVCEIALQFADALCAVVAQAPIPMAGAISKIGELLVQLGEDKTAIEPRPVTDQIRLTMQLLIKRLIRKGRHLYVLVDDLDRCSPRNVVRLFEWFKNHLDVARCTYIIGLDHRMAARVIAGEYSRYTAAGGKHNLDYGYRYLDKLFELDFEILPTPGAQSMALRKYGLTGDVAQWTRKRLGKDFSGEAEMKALLSLPALWIPRVMIRTFGTYRMALDALLQADRDERIRLRNDLPSSYPFWLFLLCALHHLFSPDKVEAFSRQDLKSAEKGPIGQVLNPEGDLEPIDPRVDLVEQLDDLPKKLDPLPKNQLRYLYGVVRDKTPGTLSVA